MAHLFLLSVYSVKPEGTFILFSFYLVKPHGTFNFIVNLLCQTR